VLLVAAVALGISAPVVAAPARYEPTKASLDAHPLPAWWSEGKFGIFIHWGVYSVPAWAPLDELGKASDITPYAEWYGSTMTIPGSATYQYHLQTYGQDFAYDDFIPRFTAAKFDPDAWVELFGEAGAKYFVLTSKHHDGFALWCTKTTQRNSCDMGPRRDLVGELFAAAHRAKHRVKPGLYYSIPEWFNPAPRPKGMYSDAEYAADPATQLAYAASFGDVFPNRNPYTMAPVPYTGYVPIDDYATGQVIPQVEELIQRYRPYELWCDIGGRGSYFQSNRFIADFFNAARTSNPDGVVVDNRCGDTTTHGDFATPEYSPTFPKPPFESTRGMGLSFGYNQLEDAAGGYLSAAELIKTLIDNVSHGGNLLLDIGPKADGTIPQPMIERLRAMGAWLKINGEAIYATNAWTQPAAGNVRFTVGKAGFLYATALGWPGTQLTIDAPVPTPPGTRIALLGSSERPLAFHRDGTKLVVDLPDQGATTSQHAYTVRIGRRLRPRLAASGRLILPRGVTRAMGCRGTVSLTTRRQGRIVARRKIAVRPDCRFRSHSGALIRFNGNPVLLPARGHAPRRAPSR